MSMPSQSKDTRLNQESQELSDLAKKHFVLFYKLNSEYLDITLNKIPLLPQSLQGTFTCFLEALDAISDSICLPQRMALEHTYMLNYQLTKISALHSLNNKGYQPGESRSEAAARIIEQAKISTENKMQSQINSDEGINEFVKQSALAILGRKEQRANIFKAARELRFQSTVAIWSAFETLAKDSITTTLNNNPHTCKKFLNDEKARSALDLKKISIEDLIESDFNFSYKMGDFLINSKDFSSFNRLKILLTSLLDNAKLYSFLDQNEIKLLNLQRHLIVHRRGVVDERYLRESSSNQKIGETVEIPPSLIVNYYRVIAEVGSLLCNAFIEFSNSAKP